MNYGGDFGSFTCGAIAAQTFRRINGISFCMNQKKRGRKPINPGQPMDRKVVTLDELTLRKLKVLGEGNISAGVRRAAEVAFARYQKE